MTFAKDSAHSVAEVERMLAGLTVAIGIPAYSEGRGIAETLDSVWRACQVLHLGDVSFLLSDSSPAPTTVQAAQEWASRCDVSLIVDHSPTRRSVKEALNVVLERCSADVLVLVDADVVLDDNALVHLLALLLRPPSAAVAIGVTLPDRRYRQWNRRAGRWQLSVVNRLARMLPDDAIRAEGALWAARRSFYGSFRFQPGHGSLAGDVELADAVRRSGVSVRNAKDAVAYKVPPAGARDFALGYLRARAASARSGGRDSRRAALRQLIADPLGGAMYVAYRVGVWRRRGELSVLSASERWERPWSTVHPGEPRW